MLVLTAEVFFDLENHKHDPAKMIDNLNAELQCIKEAAARHELRAGLSGMVAHSSDEQMICGHWWIDPTNMMYKQRFQAVELDGYWHVLDHKHPEFISPVFSEEDARRCAQVWSESASTPESI